MHPQPVPVSLGVPRSTAVDTRTFLVTEVFYPGGSRLPRHHHDRTVVAVALQGRWDSVLGATRFELAAGDLTTQPAGAAHSNHFTRDGAHVLVVQPDPASHDLLQPCEALLRTGSRLSVPEAPSIAERIRRELHSPDSLSRLAIDAGCLELLAAAARASGAARKPGAPRWLQRIAEYMHEHYLETHTVEGLSRIGGVHPAHFAREFRRTYRLTPAAYLRHLRIEWAARQLTRIEIPIVEIAAAAGFADQSHFTRLFRKATGMTPAAFRRERGPGRL